jgi:hypothetical protein
MKDTPPDVARRYQDLLMQRSGEARLRMGWSMYAAARAIVVASIRAKEPDASPARVRQALFLRFYGGDFDPVTRARILQALAAERPARSASPRGAE